MKKLMLTAAITSLLVACGSPQSSVNSVAAAKTATTKNLTATLPPQHLLTISAHHYLQTDVAGQQLQFVLDKQGLKVIGAASQQPLATASGNFVRLTSQALAGLFQN